MHQAPRPWALILMPGNSAGCTMAPACRRGGRRESEDKRGGRDKPGHDEAKGSPYGTTMASGLPRSRLTMSLLRAPR